MFTNKLLSKKSVRLPHNSRNCSRPNVFKSHNQSHKLPLSLQANRCLCLNRCNSYQASKCRCPNLCSSFLDSRCRCHSQCNSTQTSSTMVVNKLPTWHKTLCHSNQLPRPSRQNLRLLRKLSLASKLKAKSKSGNNKTNRNLSPNANNLLKMT